MSRAEDTSETRTPEYDLEDVFDQLDDLEETVSSAAEKKGVRQTRRMLEGVPGRERIKKYTGRDIAEGFVGGVIFSLPLLVEDGVFEIADWFTTVMIGPFPVLLALNVLSIIALVAGILYFTDFRDVDLRLVFGVIPKRLFAVLIISFLVAAGTMLMWGRLHEEDPTSLEVLGRITVIWAAAALGATLGDLLPGESSGEDLATLLTETDETGDDQTQQ